MQVVTAAVVDGLRSLRHSVQVVEPSRFLNRLWSIYGGQFDVVVFTHGPGFGAVLRTVLISLANAKVVWLCTRPRLGAVPRWLLRLVRLAVAFGNPVDDSLRLTLSSTSARYAGVVFGVDLAKFHRAPSPERSVFSTFGVDTERPVLLHVGHVRPNRGIDRIIELKAKLGSRANVVVLASPHFEADPALLAAMAQAGIVVRHDYIEDVSVFYRGADLYLFPVDDRLGGAIDVPLSVLEALACGTPVITAPFGLLPKMFADRAGIHIVSSEQFVSRALQIVLSNGLERVTWELPKEFDIKQLAPGIVAAVSQ
jgi:glycosyltransferase involved in cell wall biosynthesis